MDHLFQMLKPCKNFYISKKIGNQKCFKLLLLKNTELYSEDICSVIEHYISRFSRSNIIDEHVKSQCMLNTIHSWLIGWDNNDYLQVICSIQQRSADCTDSMFLGQGNMCLQFRLVICTIILTDLLKYFLTCIKLNRN